MEFSSEALNIIFIYSKYSTRISAALFSDVCITSRHIMFARSGVLQAKLYGGSQPDSIMQQATFLRLYGIILRKTFSKDLVTSHLDIMTEMALQWTSGIATSSTTNNEDVSEYGRKEEACWSSFAEEISNGFAHGLGMSSASHLDLALERLEQLLVRLGTLPFLSLKHTFSVRT